MNTNRVIKMICTNLGVKLLVRQQNLFNFSRALFSEPHFGGIVPQAGHQMLCPCFPSWTNTHRTAWLCLLTSEDLESGPW